MLIDVDGTDVAPVMIHRAVCGSLERMMGVLAEHHSGKYVSCVAGGWR